ncbi:MAG: type II toxin-antitoxin system YafQ family toxin [Burkholderiaceae bacterium]|jgi:mRNA interferase YafQ|nr:type II toxin-antitoxin system YafQ family toxin [Burkholderiaceae bacterium]
MRKIEVTTAFRRDFKRESKGAHRAILDTALKQVIAALAGDRPLPAKYHDHALTGNWKAYRDCHVRPDLVLIYRHAENPRRLVLARLGSHSELDL